MGDRLPQLTKREALGVVLVLSIGFTALASTLDIEVLADVFAVLGFVVLLPLVGILGDRLPFVAAAAEEDTAESTIASGGIGEPGKPSESNEQDEQIATLRQRYARGEIDETEFERRLEALLTTEDIDAAQETDHEHASDRERTTDRDRSTELE